MALFFSTVFCMFLTTISGSHVVNGCHDIYSQLCKVIHATKPDLCSDPCIAGVCKQSCGQCALQCYTCHQVDDVSNCTSTHTCPFADDLCFTTQTFTDRFTETYRLGCAAKDTCRQYSGISRHYRIPVDAGCCDTDKCNNKPPALLRMTRTQVSTSNTTSCTDIDTTLCKELKMDSPDICRKDCIANLVCPNTCAMCVQCLECDSVSSPSDCVTTTSCVQGNECYITEKLEMTPSKQPALQLGCISEQLCHQFHNYQTPILFGKRQEQFMLQGACCKGHLCNYVYPFSHLTTSKMQATTTSLSSTSPVMTFNMSKVSTALLQRTTTPVTTSLQSTMMAGNTKTETNQRVNMTLPIVSTTPVTNGIDCSAVTHVHCPDLFYSLHGTCFVTGPLPLSFDKSKAYCERQCLHLAQFDRQSDLTSVTRHFLHRSHDLPLYIGATKGSINDGGWSWVRGHLPVNVLFWIRHNDNGNCVVTREVSIPSHKHGHEHYVYGLENVNCTNKYRPLCQLYLK